VNSFLGKQPVLENKFLLQRALNKVESPQHKYIERDTFEEMCSNDEWKKNDLIKFYGRRRMSAALFPNTFLFHFKALIIDFGAFYFDQDIMYLPLLSLAANMATKSWKDLCGHEQQSFYVDVDPFIDVGHILPSGGVVALCKNFQEEEKDGDPQGNSSIQYGIGQDMLILLLKITPTCKQ
jgi:hypothetical protein